jgi:hypothetical protein
MSGRNVRVIVVGLVVAAVVIIAIAVAAWPQNPSRSETARASARQIACNVSQHGLGIRPCAKVVEFTPLAPATWRVRVQGVPGCFLVHSGSLLTQRRCRLSGL